MDTSTRMKDKKIKTFVVVKFTEEDDAPAVIHKNWLCDDSRRTIWPPKPSLKHLKNGTFLKDWSSHPCQILSSSDSLDKANQKMRDLERFSDIDTTEVEGRKKKRRKLTNLIVSDLSEESSDINSDLDSRLPQFNFSQDKGSSSMTQKSHCSVPSSTVEHCNSLDAPAPVTNRNELLYTPSPAPKRSRNLFNVSSTPNGDKSFEDSSPAPKRNESLLDAFSSAPNCNRCCNLMEKVFLKFEELKDEVKDLKRIILTSQNKNNPQTWSHSSKFPIKRQEDFEELENLMNESKEEKEKLVEWLTVRSGTSTSSGVVFNCLDATLNHSATTFLNWSGKKGSVRPGPLKIKLKNSFLHAAIMGVLYKRNLLNSTKELESHCKEWLKKAYDLTYQSKRKQLACKDSNVDESLEDSQTLDE